MKAIVFERFGDPAEVLSVREVPTPEPGPGEVRVRMIASPVNPSDLLFIRGNYTVVPKLPAIPGFEGVGVVERAGPGLLGRLALGKRVTVINGAGGNWAESVVIPAKQARPVPKDIPDEQVASFFVNPGTALAIVRHVLRVGEGEWLAQSAAGSELGRMIIRLGRRDGFKTLNIVRRREAIGDLKALGGDAVISTSDGPVAEQVREVVGPGGLRFAIDAVGGETGTGLFDALGDPGQLVIYGSLSGEPVRLDPRRLISGNRRVRGFWLGHWMRERSIPGALLHFREIARLIRQGVLSTEVGPRFPMSDVIEAARRAEAPGRRGKILLELGEAGGPRA